MKNIFQTFAVAICYSCSLLCINKIWISPTFSILIKNFECHNIEIKISYFNENWKIVEFKWQKSSNLFDKLSQSFWFTLSLSVLRPNLSFFGFQVNKSKSIEDEKLLTGRCWWQWPSGFVGRSRSVRRGRRPEVVRGHTDQAQVLPSHSAKGR